MTHKATRRVTLEELVVPDLATRTSDHRKRETYGELGLGARDGRKEEKGIILQNRPHGGPEQETLNFLDIICGLSAKIA